MFVCIARIPGIQKLCGIVLACFTFAVAAQSAESLDFSRDVLPILSDRCFFCHGPDSSHREADLRLDVQEPAHEWVIVPGKPDESELIRRVFSLDPDEVMPPPAAKIPLNESEKAILREWVESGAAYGQHWAFTAVRRPLVLSPGADEGTGIESAKTQAAKGSKAANSGRRHPIDVLVQDRLRELGLTPSGEADRVTLIRRLSFDLTGLPPTIDEIDRFVGDADPNAYENLVDRLLQSARFGERMAVDWLDVARYADTYGYQNDRYRDMWPWRDWVIGAFNDNLGYDEFITWQLAGDLLPNATSEQILATAFNRNHRQTNEGGSVEEEFRAEYVADRVNTFGAAFLGLTLECARCHDHKYDPITQREYYQLAAFFNSIDESGLYSHFTSATPTPTLLLPEPATEQSTTELRQTIRQRQQQLDELQPTEAGYQDWRQSLTDVRPTAFQATRIASGRSLAELLTHSLQANLVGHFKFEDLEDDQLRNEVESGESGAVQDAPQLIAGRVGNGLLLSGDNSATVKAGGDFTRNDPFSISLWLQAPTRFERAVVYHRSRAWTDSGSRGYELLIEDGKLSAALIHFWPGNALRVRTVDELPPGRWTQVTVVYDGSSRAEGLHIYVDGRLADVEVVRDKLTKNIQGGGGDVHELAIGQRFRDKGFKQGKVDELRVFRKDLCALEAQFLYVRDAAEANLREVLYNVAEPFLKEYFLRQQEAYEALAAELHQLRDDYSKQYDAIPEIMVMRELPEPRTTYVLVRGAYDAPGEPVRRGFPVSIAPELSQLSREGFPAAGDGPRLEAGQKLDRLSLASWLVDPRNPLTSRVAVNRFWQMFFGRGLVATPEDFGMQGRQPSHPELLDWLAAEFVDSGWDVKQLVKQIVMSDTYRRSSDPTLELLEKDPENLWLARGPVLRLPAEMIRDTALAASELLVEKIGGPPVKPYQPEGLWEEKSGEVYRRDEGEGSHRRSLYTFWKRTSPPPSMMTFDASNREVCSVNRPVTTTPLQMLVLWNDPQFVEAARALATIAMQEHQELPSRLICVFRRLISRTPDQAELAILENLYQQQLTYFRADSQRVADYLVVGEQRLAEGLDRAAAAALSVVAQALMSHDETVMKR